MDNSTTFQGNGEVAYIPVVVNGKQTNQTYDPFKKTNGDNFRAMTDEELAEWLARNCDCTPSCMAMTPYCSRSEKDCVQAWKIWLRQECE